MFFLIELLILICFHIPPPCLGSNFTTITHHCHCLSTGGVIAYISSGSASSPESCMSTSPSSGYLSTSPPVSRPSLPSRAVGLVVDISPPAKNGHPRSHGTEKAGRSSTSAKSSITSKKKVLALLEYYTV